MESACLLMKISSPAVRPSPPSLCLTNPTPQDALWSGLLLDPIGLPSYISLNRSRLAASYTRATQFLSLHQIPFRPSNAGHFIWIDLCAFLPARDGEGRALESGVAREEELARKFTEGGVNVVRPSFNPFGFRADGDCRRVDRPTRTPSRAPSASRSRSVRTTLSSGWGGWRRSSGCRVRSRSNW